LKEISDYLTVFLPFSLLHFNNFNKSSYRIIFINLKHGFILAVNYKDSTTTNDAPLKD
jgi:hypothetical protein